MTVRYKRKEGLTLWTKAKNLELSSQIEQAHQNELTKE